MKLENDLNKNLYIDELHFHLFNLIPINIDIVEHYNTMDSSYLCILSEMHKNSQNLRRKAYLPISGETNESKT